MRRLSLGRYDVAAYLFYMAYSASSVTVPIVLYELSHELGFPLSSGGGGMSGALQISRGVMMVLSMVVCGFTAARFGKVNAILASVLAMGVGITLVAFSKTYWFVFLVLALAGFGEGHIEGLGTPFIQDVHSDDDPARYVIFGHGFWSLGIVLASLVIGLVLYCNVSWRAIVIGCGAFCLVPIAWLSRCDNRYRDTSASSASDVRKKTRAVLKCPRFYLFFVAMLFAGGGEFVFTFWTPALIRLEFADSAFMS
ncbi:MAG: MFS transporter, partial [Victivallaceae bacterium]|nr:MFS transporter [Victivallaceae bacterium]